MNQSMQLTRSKSDEHTVKFKVLSPTPIRENGTLLLNRIFESSSFQRNLDAQDLSELESRFIVRKFQSLDMHELQHLS
jgi:hypothetical protein